LAEGYPKLSFIVQDLEAAITSGVESLPAGLHGRVQFEVHDMFQPQTGHDVDVFYLRHILHDWPDDWAVKILKNLVPAMGPNSRVIISDSVIPPPEQLQGLHEKFVRYFSMPSKSLKVLNLTHCRYLDLQMMVLHNAQERTEEHFAQLLARANPRLKIKQVWRKGSDAAASTIVEAVLVD
jgi:6-hydroxytryprostatin B O-methyltransferase